MPEINKVLGNKDSIEHIKESAKKGLLPHGFIISGEKGSGKKTMAEYIAAGFKGNAGRIYHRFMMQ